MKTAKLLAQVLVLLLGMAVAAPAVTIHTPWRPCHRHENLYQIITAWGFPVDNDALQSATPLESLPAGHYSIDHYAQYTGKAGLLGIYPLAITPPARDEPPPTGAIPLLRPRRSGDWACDITFSAPSDFGFFDDARRKHVLLTTQNQNSAANPYYQSSGLIFDLGEINPLYGGHYIVAFEKGRKHRPFGDLDYNDLVVCVNLVPLPGTLPLVGGGLLFLGMVGFYQRLLASPG
jgi:hypothetical protein